LLEVLAEARIDKFVLVLGGGLWHAGLGAGHRRVAVPTRVAVRRVEADRGVVAGQSGPAADLKHTSLRYFNVVGSGYPDLRDTSPHSLFPLVFEQLMNGRVPYINGNNYPTPDGTCVRDYVHVADLATAHVPAARALADGGLWNRSTTTAGPGLSVGEIMTAVARVTGIDFTPDIKPPRRGDPAQIVATGNLAARDLDWKMRHSVADMVASAWQARQPAAWARHSPIWGSADPPASGRTRTGEPDRQHTDNAQRT
jgi:nucleoside-diphosphate-sugar epimerase